MRARFLGVLSIAGSVGACTGTSTTDETTTTMSATEESGDLLVPQAGEYEVTLVQQTSMCRTVMESASWRLTMNLPEGGGEWELVEDYAGMDILRKDPYPCNLEGDFALCQVNKKKDYADQMILAEVTSAIRLYEFRWTSDTELDGLIEVDLRCQGSGCVDIAVEWQVAEWPCMTSAQFTAVKVD